MSIMATTDTIRLEHVRLTLGGHEVLKDVTFGAPQGHTTAILGASGSGKTTILRVVLGLYRANAGIVLIQGREITTLSERDMQDVRRSMAMVFQNAALFDSLTVGENVGYRLTEQALLSEEDIERKVRESLRFVGLDDIIDKMPTELSGGMRKRVAIARALASGAPILLYDEPTAGLDPINTCMIRRLIRTLKAQGMTQVVVTHDLETADDVADRIVMMQRGRVIFDGTPAGLRNSDQPAVQGFLDPSSVPASAYAFAPPDFDDDVGEIP